MLKRLFTALLASIICLTLSAQTSFIPDKHGVVHDEKFSALIATRGYQLVSAFDTVNKKPLLIYALYMKNNKFGIMDITGKEIAKAEYDEIPGLNKSYSHAMFGFHDHYTVKKGKFYGVINQKGKLVIPVMYDYISYKEVKQESGRGIRRDSLFEATKGNRVIIMNVNGKILSEKKEEVYEVTEVTERSFDDFRLSDVVAPQSNRSNGRNSKHGNIIRQTYGIAVIESKVDGKYLQGAIKLSNDTLIFPAVYHSIYIDRYSRFITSMDKKYTIADSTGKRLLAGEFDRIEEFNGTYRIYNDKKMALYDKNLKAISDFEYDERTGSANGEVMILSKGGKYGLVDISGKLMIDFKYDQLQYFTFRNKKGIPFVQAVINNKCALVSATGKELTAFEYDAIRPVSSIYTGGGGGGYEAVMPPDEFEYDESNKYFIVRIGRKYGLLDSNMKPLLPVEYDDIHKAEYDDMVYIGMKSDVRNVQYGVWSIVKKDYILPVSFDENIKCGPGRYFVVRKNNLYGLFDKDGKMILPIEHKTKLYPEFMYNGMIMSKTRTDIFYIDYRGKYIHEKLPNK